MSNDKIRARLYIDGNFAFHIFNYLIKTLNVEINWIKLIDYIKELICKEEENKRNCVLESHYFVGTKSLTTDQDRDYFYNSLDHAGISKHATPLKGSGDKGLKEDAVDTNLVFNATKDFYQNKASYDYLVLFAGDSDFVPLTRGLKNAEAVKVCVVYMDFNGGNFGTTKASSELLDSADFTINISDLQRLKPDCFYKINKSLSNEYPEKDNDDAFDSDKTQNSEATANPFSWEQISQAIIKAQKSFHKGQNEFVLVSQVGIQLKSILGKKVHGKLMPILENVFKDKIQFAENTKSGSEKIKFRN